MKLLERVYKQVLLESGYSENKINRAIDTHRLVVIRYNTHGEHVAMANRLCGVFAYGTTKAGNPCIRVFEYQGDTTTFVPGWKLIRLDRILSWFETNKTISEPPDNYGVGDFNPNGDNSMSMVYKVAKFDGIPVSLPNGNQPKTNASVKGGVSRKQAQQTKNDAQKTEDGLKPYQDKTTNFSNEPKTAQDVKGKERVGLDSKYANKPVAKTSTEKAIDYLRRQLEKPEKIDLSKFGRKQKPTQFTVKPEKTEKPNVQQATPVVQKPIERQGIDSRYADKPLMKTDTENAMEYLKRQLENPEKLDLTKIPKK
ncbi:MAG: hypothetical protein J6X18_09030 [Bacteroidales bacterium]|nr:hypothetical protein [Bacteroidales bacterium]